MHAVRVSETKLTTPANAFVVDLFPLGGEKELKYDERMLLKRPNVFFRTILVLAFFWPIPITFRN